MTINYINIGSSANKGDGDTLRTAFRKINENFAFISTASGFISTGSSTSLSISPTAPTTAADGTLWFNSTEARTFVRYNGAWVDASPQITPPPTTSTETVITMGSVPPGTGEGTLWFNINDARTYINYSGAWVDSSPQVSPPPVLPTDELGVLANDGAGNLYWSTSSVSINFTASVNFLAVGSNILPLTNATYDLGSLSKQWRSLYVGTSTIYIGGVAVSINTVSNTLVVGTSTQAVTLATENYVTAQIAAILPTESYIGTGNFIVTATDTVNYVVAGTGVSTSTVIFNFRIHGSVGGVAPGVSDPEYVTITTGAQPVSEIYLTKYVSSDNRAFFAVQEGNQWTIPQNQVTPEMLAYSHFGINGVQVGQNILNGFGPLEPNTTYTFWIQQIGSAATEYVFSTNRFDTGGNSPLFYSQNPASPSTIIPTTTVVGGELDPTLSLIRGYKYTFNVNAPGQPLWIMTTSTYNITNSYTHGVTNNGTSTGIITFTVPGNAPNKLYYISENSSLSMKGVINITDISSGSGDRLVNGEYEVVLGTDGKLTLPDGQSIGSGTLDGIKLTTDRGTVLFGNTPECVPTVASHFHIMRDDPTTVDLFFGDDFNYVKLPYDSTLTNVGVQIGTDATNLWSFGKDGTLTLPSGNTRIGDFNGLDAMVGSTGTGVGVASQGMNGYVALEWIDNIENIGTTASTQVAAVVVNNPIASTSGTVQIVTGIVAGPTAENVWEFGVDGNLTVPDDIQDANGSVIRVATTSTAPTRVDGQLWFDNSEGRLYIKNNGLWLDASPTQIPSPETYLDNIEIDGNNIILPPGGDILDSNGVSVLGGDSTSGNVWVQTFESATPLIDTPLIALSVEYDSVGNVIALFYNVEDSGGTYYSVGKYTATGTRIWTTRFSTGYETDGWGLAVDPTSGFIYVAGKTNTDGGQQKSTLTKIASGGGSVGWSKTYAFGIDINSNSQVVDVASDGNPVMVGYTFDGYVTTTKVDAEDGSIIWSKKLDGQGDEEAYGMAVGPSGEVVAVGYMDQLGGEGDTDNHMLVVKYLSDGTIDWQKAILFDAGYDSTGADADIDSEGNVYVCGQYEVNIVVPGICMNLVKFNSAGVKQWSRRVEGDCGSIATSIVVGDDDKLYLSGSLFTTTVPDPGPGDPVDISCVVAKYNLDGTVVWQRLLDNIDVLSVSGSDFLSSQGGGSNLAVKQDYVALAGGFGTDPGDFRALIAQLPATGDPFTVGAWDFKASNLTGTLDSSASDITVVNADKTDTDNVSNITVATVTPIVDSSAFLIGTLYTGDSTTALGDRLTAGNSSVVLGSTGTLTLPQGGTISEIAGDSSSYGILLTPYADPQYNPNMAVKIYPTFNDDDHIHITAGNPTTVDLFLGDDDQYVKLEQNSGNIVVGTNTTVTNSTWTFGTDGTLEFPQGSTISETIATTGTHGTTIIQAHIQNDLLLNTYDYVNSTLRTWTFGTDGTLEFPQGSTISETNTTTIISPPGASAGQSLVIRPTGSTSTTETNHIHLISGNPTTVDLFLGDDDQYVKIEKNGGNIVVGTYSTATTSTWTFGTDGVLTLSTASTILGSGTDPNVYIETLTTATTSTWTFGTDGILTLPAATPVIKGGGTGTDVSIVASTGTNPAVWMFEADGSLTFPDGYLKIVPNGANPYISNRTDNGLGLVSGSAIQIRQSVADAYGISIDSSTTDTSLGGGASLASGSNIDVNGTKIILGQYTSNYLDANTGLTVQNKIEINNDEILIGQYVSNLTSGSTISAFSGWTFSNTGTVTFPDATVQTTAWTGSTSTLVNGTYTVALATTGQLNLPGAANTESDHARIQSANSIDILSNLSIWTFGTDGKLTFPNGPKISIPSGTPRTGAIAITSSTELLIGTNTTTTNNLWTFGIDGSTILPENTLKGYCFTATNSVFNYLPQSAQFLYTDSPILGLISTIGGSWYIKGPGLVGWKPVTAVQDNSGVALIVRIGSGAGPMGDGSEFHSGGYLPTSPDLVYTISQYLEFDLKAADKTWTFSENGSLTFPNNTVQTTAYKSTSGSWTLATGSNTVSITVPLNNNYQMWVNGNVPNGIVEWNATVNVSNPNVPAIGSQYAWYYALGNALVLTAIPNQIVGTVGVISTSSSYVGNTANVFTFGITNNSTSTQVINWGYTTL